MGSPHGLPLRNDLCRPRSSASKNGIWQALSALNNEPAVAVPLCDLTGFDTALSASAGDIEVFRTALKDARAELEARFNAGNPAHVLVRQLAGLVDELLVRVWQHFGLHQNEALALIAVGGYGRGELHPGSDVDLLILLGSHPGQADQERIREFVTFLWDIGLEVGHSVRTLDDCATLAVEDITVVTNQMEARLICGPHALLEQLRERTGPEKIWPSREFFQAKWREQRRRHAKFHDTAYNLEPNVKEGPGGIRDIQVVGWVVKRHFGAETLHDLVTQGFLTESEYETLIEEQNFLWQVRFALHMLTGRREDRLLFDYQRVIADRFGYRDQEHKLGVEQFMKRYYRSIGELSRLNEMLLELFQEAILLADIPTEIVPINNRFRARNGFLEVVNRKVFKRYPFALLELFLILQQNPDLKGVRASTIRLVRDHRYLMDEAFRDDIRCRSLFLEIIRQPRGITHELRRMHRYGVLAAYLPEFAAVVGQMQYDLFHVYSVDEHSLFVVRNLRSFAIPEKQHEFPLCSAIFQRLPKPELLYLAGLFHDLAKGRGGDHSELGAEDALKFCLNHGLSEYDSRLVAWLVRHHLIMSVTSQRQDIHDPDVIQHFVGRVRDRIHLDYLYLLTVADIRATNPNLWNNWKDALLKDLYECALRAFRRGLENPLDKAQLIQDRLKTARRLIGLEADEDTRVEDLWRHLGDDYFVRNSSEEIAWHTRAIIENTDNDLPLVLVREGRGGTEIFVYAEDQKYLFAATTATLTGLGLTILDARIITAQNGMTLDSYVVQEESGERISEARQLEIQNALRVLLHRPENVSDPTNRLPKRQLKHFPIQTVVSFFSDEANNRTVMEISAGDRPGLLSLIGWALVACGVRLQNAKIATFGERAEDVFFITNAANQPLSEQGKQSLRNTISRTLSPGQNGS